MTSSISSASVQAAGDKVEWRVTGPPVDYAAAVAEMEAHAAAIRDGSAGERVWLLEHPALYTAGSSARDEDLLNAGGLTVYRTGRGGQYTWHGPGQRIAYVMLDLRRRGQDVRRYVRDLEDWIILALTRFNVKGERREDRIGIWVDRGNGREDKIAAIGVRVRRWVTYHGLAINVEPDLGHFAGIVPCGIDDAKLGVTSLVDLGLPVTMADLDSALMETFAEVFGKG